MRPLMVILWESFLVHEVDCLVEIRKLRALAAAAVSKETTLKQSRLEGLKIIRELFGSE